MSFHNIEAQWGTTEGSTKVEFKFQRNPMTDEGTGVSLPDCHDYNKTTVSSTDYTVQTCKSTSTKVWTII